VNKPSPMVGAGAGWLLVTVWLGSQITVKPAGSNHLVILPYCVCYVYLGATSLNL
jgi:hypothetical protein